MIRNPLYVITNSFLDAATGKRVIGGTETYTDALINLASRLNVQCVVFQRSEAEIQLRVGPNCHVSSWRNVSDLRHKLKLLRSRDSGIAIFYQELFCPSSSEQPTVLVQHGIGSDGVADPADRSLPARALADLRRKQLAATGARRAFKLCSSVSKVICVDTNFINQMRSTHPAVDWGDRLEYVPNFADLSDENVVCHKWTLPLERPVVLFARRFNLHRGTLLWAECLRTLAQRFPTASFRAVGFGEEEARLQRIAASFANVAVYPRAYEEMRAEHEAAHISVVPSLWSEGTSLSCIEAMAAGCAVVVSNVGGLGNLVVPDFNGIILPPVASRFTAAVAGLLENMESAKTMALNAYQMARVSFSRAVWESRVTKILQGVMEEPVPRPLLRRVRPSVGQP